MSIIDIISEFKNAYPDLPWTLTPMDKDGVLSTNTFKQAKEQKTNPAELASQLVQDIQESFPDYDITHIGPYINVNLSANQWSGFSEEVIGLNLKEKDSTKVLVDYVGTNVAKKLHIGHLRALDIGGSLLRILKVTHSNVISDNHWGDWGVTIGILLWGWKKEGDQNAYAADPMTELTRVYVWSNAQKEHHANWEEETRLEFKKLEDKDPENVSLWKDFISTTKSFQQQTFNTFNVPEFNLEQGESFYEDDMKKLTSFLDQHNLWHKDGLARYVDYEELSNKIQGIDDQTRKKISHFGRGYLISSLGYTTYLFRDVAARWQWARDHHIGKAVTLTDFTQNHNFNQTFAFITWLAEQKEFQEINESSTIQKLTWDNLFHVGFGLVKLKEGKMSSRKGNVILLEDVYDQTYGKVLSSLKERVSDTNPDKVRKIAVAALKWYDLNRNPQEDITLDIDTILQFEGNTGVYQLYTRARLYSILKKNTYEIDFSWDELTAQEQKICKRILLLQQEIVRSAKDLNPSYIAQALYAFSSDINSWYNTTNVTNETNKNRKNSLLHLINISVKVFDYYLDLLGIETVDTL